MQVPHHLPHTYMATDWILISDLEQELQYPAHITVTTSTITTYIHPQMTTSIGKLYISSSKATATLHHRSFEPVFKETISQNLSKHKKLE